MSILEIIYAIALEVEYFGENSDFSEKIPYFQAEIRYFRVELWRTDPWLTWFFDSSLHTLEKQVLIVVLSLYF